MERPQQSEQLHQQVKDEPAMVPLSHTVLDPRAVMVKTPHAAFTRLAVLGSHWLLLKPEKKKTNNTTLILPYNNIIQSL